jgi:hypothetical protein
MAKFRDGFRELRSDDNDNSRCKHTLGWQTLLKKNYRVSELALQLTGSMLHN